MAIREAAESRPFGWVALIHPLRIDHGAVELGSWSRGPWPVTSGAERVSVADRRHRYHVVVVP